MADCIGLLLDFVWVWSAWSTISSEAATLFGKRVRKHKQVICNVEKHQQDWKEREKTPSEERNLQSSTAIAHYFPGGRGSKWLAEVSVH